jgi:hypothetical protein
VFQLILPFQLELPFDGARGGAPASDRDGVRGKVPATREAGARGKRARRERRAEASHSLELPLSSALPALEADA